MKLLDVAKMMEDSLPHKSFPDSIHFDKPKGTEWLNGVFRRHIDFLGSDLESSTPQCSVVSSVVVVGYKKKAREPAGGPEEASKARYLERVKDSDLEDLACRQELIEVLELKSLSHEDLNNHYCVDWLKAHEAHFSRDKTFETADLTGIPKKSIMGPVN